MSSEAARNALRRRWCVERHDNEDGSIAYEVWSIDGEHRVFRLVDDDDPFAKRDAEHIVALHNNSLGPGMGF